ncbi:hypothetical protein T484DRAFT_1831228 [Baffinella frigidus]|nr:hypothetical protein T484DRAFT_1831228 [Cryptophyta sp. CCMP2293]
MTSCANCEKHVEKSKSCAKCRSVAYCSADCQKADWQTHKTTCKPCAQYVVDQVWALHKSKQWRKVIKWHPYIEEHIFAQARIQDNPQLNAQVFKVRYVFAAAYTLGITATNDPDNVYAKAAVPAAACEGMPRELSDL